MNTRPKSSCLFLVLLLLPSLAPAQDAAVVEHWFYMVKTEPSDPARDAEFNAWYDDIDIPDVLEVPSFKRASRAVTVEASGFPSIQGLEGDGTYVALYEIETTDIDTSIIDLYVAARKMSALGRLTDVLKVVEANYYRRLASYEFVNPEDKSVYFFIEKILCCNNAESKQNYELWYQNQYLPALENVNGLLSINFYELYRIMEVLSLEPEEIPHHLLVYEIDGGRVTDVLTEVTQARGLVNTSDGINLQPSIGSRILYRQLTEVLSE